jgi:hypothetical protein
MDLPCLAASSRVGPAALAQRTDGVSLDHGRLGGEHRSHGCLLRRACSGGCGVGSECASCCTPPRTPRERPSNPRGGERPKPPVWRTDRPDRVSRAHVSSPFRGSPRAKGTGSPCLSRPTIPVCGRSTRALRPRAAYRGGRRTEFSSGRRMTARTTWARRGGGKRPQDRPARPKQTRALSAARAFCLCP